MVTVGGFPWIVPWFLEPLPERCANMHWCQVTSWQSPFLLCKSFVWKLALCCAVYCGSLLQEFCQCDAIFFPTDGAAQNFLNLGTEKGCQSLLVQWCTHDSSWWFDQGSFFYFVVSQWSCVSRCSFILHVTRVKWHGTHLGWYDSTGERSGHQVQHIFVK